MVIFSLIAAGLIAVVTVAMLFVVPPLLDKLQKKPTIAPKGMIAKLLGGPVAALVVGITIPVLAVMLYLTRPHDATVTPDQPPVATPVAKSEKMAPEHAQVVEDMAARLEQNPNDGEGWYMLGHSYAVMGRYAEGVAAYEKAAKLLPDNAQLLVDYADVLAVANDRNLRGKPIDLVNKALKIDPQNVKGLALLGTAAFQSGDYASAEKFWGKVLKLLPPEDPFARQMSSGVAEAHAMATGKKTTPSFGKNEGMTGAAQAEAQPVTARISGVLTLSPALASKASPNDAVFLSAKEPGEGEHAPVAVIRVQVKDLPLQFTLDDSTAMMQGVNLSNFQEVTVSAKISKSGNTKTQSGDLTGEVASVKIGANGVQVVINKIAP